jgi:hypothetical protein
LIFHYKQLTEKHGKITKSMLCGRVLSMVFAHHLDDRAKKRQFRFLLSKSNQNNGKIRNCNVDSKTRTVCFGCQDKDLR